MNNSALQALIDEFGDRICIIIFDNNSRAYVGYPSSTLKHVDEIKMRTFGGVDMVGISKKHSYAAAGGAEVYSTNWHPTECIQQVIIVDEGYERFLVDPLEVG